MVAECRAQRALLHGRLDEAETIIDEALALGRSAQQWNARISHLLQLFLLRRLQGRLDEVLEALRATAAEYPSYPISQCALIYTLTNTGHEPEARRLLDEVAADGFAGVPFDEGWLCSLCLLAETACAFGARDHCRVLHDLLLPYADRIACSYSEISTGAVCGYLGLLAEALGRADEAAQHYADALAINGRVGAEPWLVMTRAAAERLPVRG